MRIKDETRFEIRGRIPPAVGWLLWAQLCLSGIALVVAPLPLCSSCGSGSGAHALVAGLGVLGYAALIFFLKKSMSTLVTVGVLAAAGVHAALAGIMLLNGSLCIVCAAAAIVALANAIIVLFGVQGTLRWITAVLVPCFSLTWIIAYFALSASAQETGRYWEAASRALRAQSDLTTRPSAGRPVLAVFEKEGCRYCREFRSSYAPRLERDFPDLQVVYRKAKDEHWVRLTPTIALGNKVLFVGLPTDYGQLALAILALSQGENTAKR